MKKILLFSLFILVNSSIVAQELPNLKHIKLNKKSHYKDIDPLVLKVTDYLFSTTVSEKNDSRREAGQFLLKWMNGTPYDTFYLEEKQTNFFNTDTELMLMYMAALTKFTLQNKSVTNQKEKVIGAMQLVLPYLDKQEHKKSWSKELWQLVDSYKNGKLVDFLDL
ncbi:hypothetical protein [Pedobacter insulae]|uniref:Uncharacterized protein n=1 Tax=Pedobacter insulae TaxID=414048 RepID=A0A1I2VYL9_9SPHI|nr:hypothetical protein [Pedobacter insulae]SFG94295.1 hypothetical protein SAMN04489864_103357 [Pedobacter insulae]